MGGVVSLGKGRGETSGVNRYPRRRYTSFYVS